MQFNGGRADMAKKQDTDNVWVKISSFFFTKWKLTFVLWAALLFIGATVYTNVIKREGFPPIQFPLSFISGVYVDQPAHIVDDQITGPISEALEDVAEVTDISASANQGFFTIAVGFDESVTSVTGTELVQRVVEGSVQLPQDSSISFAAIDPGSFIQEYDMLVQVYASGDITDARLDEAAEYVADQLTELRDIESARANSNLTTTSEGETFKTSFARASPVDSQQGQRQFHPGVVIGVSKTPESDVITLSSDVQDRLDGIDLSQFGAGTSAVIAADFARDITQQIDFLESNISTGLIAVAFVSFLLITWRASLITALFMVTVIASTILVLYLVGYTLNVITLFALILSLGLFVDDATIVVEAIDAHKRNKKLSRLAVAKTAVGKVAKASLSGTLTTVLVFAILAAPTGILGEFIRLIPITVIIALLLSFILSITLIPFMARFIMLSNDDDSWVTKNNPILRFESALGEFVEKTILRVRTTQGKLIGVGSVLLSMILVMIGFYVFGYKVDQNTFPPPKDADQIAIQTAFVPGTTLQQAEDVAKEVEQVLVDTIGEYVVFAFYGGERLPDARQSSMIIDLVPFNERSVKAPVLQEQLTEAFKTPISEQVGSISVSPIDNGPPSSSFPFGVRVYSDDEAVLDSVTQTISDTLVGKELENFNGTKISILQSQIDGVNGQVLRDSGRRYAVTRFSYDNPNPTLVSSLTQVEFEEIFTDDTVEQLLGITASDLEFDAGQEGDFQDSFNTLAYAVPIAILLMYVLLAVQFRSLLQPALILLAIPFTLFGVGIGMFLTNNAASFFVMTGFIGLIGIAVNNTIMLTDYANQERRSGKSAVEAIASASRKRLRPLVTTTLTTIVALLPLALSDPFWEALAFTIIFGLASSTILVLLSFPYYYLATEWIRTKVSRKKTAKKTKTVHA